MIKDFVFYVDFDRTLYDSHRFTTDLFSAAAKEVGITTEEVFSNLGQFFPHPTLGGYDFEAHMKAIGASPKTMWQHLEELVNTNDYLYPDSKPFIRAARQAGFDPQILSFGEERFQMIKIIPAMKMLVDEGEVLPKVTVVDRKKHEHIRELHPGQIGVLIDDVPDQELPEGFIEIHIDRSTSMPKPVPKLDGYRVSDLMQSLDIIKALA